MGPIPGHRARFGGGSVTGGVDSGTPGGVQQGKRDRWCRFWDTGHGSAGEVRQVVQIPGHRANSGNEPLFGSGKSRADWFSGGYESIFLRNK